MRVKVYALVVGVSGMGVLSQFVNLNTFIMLFGSVGFPLGLTKLISQLEKDGKWDDIKPLLKSTFIVTSSIGLALLILSFVFSGGLSQWLFGTDKYSGLVFLFGFSLPFTLAFSIFEAFMRGIKKFNSYVILTVLLTVLGLVMALIFVYWLDLLGIIIVMVLQPVMNILFYIVYIKKNRIISILSVVRTKCEFSDNIKHVFKIGLSSLLVGSLAQFSLLFVRSMIIRIYGIEGNGIYQCIYGISNNYLNLFFMTIGAYTLPVLSENNSKEFVNKEITNYFRIMTFFLVPFLSLVFVMRVPVISVFYSQKFLPAADLFFFNILGDYLRVFAWIFGLWLIPCYKMKAWLFFEITLSINLVIFFYIFVNFTGLDLNSVTLAYLVSNFIFMGFNYFYIRRKNNFRLSDVNARNFIISTAVLLLIFSVSQYNIGMAYYAAPSLLIAWGFAVINRSDVNKALLIVNSVFKKDKKENA
ncbi:MAG: oligosaccharide flippase family protein [Bacteroidetes bacterium]|nr:oligosaccharide flippase family protein [Bacteroidota bacterium]